MAKNGTSNVGGILGFVLGLALVGGLGATPLYIGLLQTDDQRRSETVEDPVDRIRRVVLNLDAHLSAMADLYTAQGDDARPDRAEIDGILEGKRNLLAKDAVARLKLAAERLQDADQRDTERGTKPGTRSVARSGPSPSAAVATVHDKLLKSHKKMIAEAEKAVRELQAAAAGSDLGSARMKAILEMAKGRIARNRAEFEQWQVVRLCRQAEGLIPVIVNLQRTAESLEAQQPTAVIAQIDERLAKNAAAYDEVEKKRGVLQGVVDALEAKVGELEAVASQDRARLVQMEASGAPIHEPGNEYAAIAAAVRQAEAAIAALRNGTLVDATVIPDDLGDMLGATYEGGKAMRGLRDQKTRLGSYVPELEALEQSTAALTERKARLTQRASELAGEAAKARDEARSKIAEATDLLEATKAHLGGASQASDSAIAAFEKAERFAKAAANAAQSWSSKARQASAEAKGPEAERLQMITRDGDMQATMQCLMGRAAYETALTLTRQLDTARIVSDSAEAVAAPAGGDLPSVDVADMAEHRNRAIARLESAALSFIAAGRSIAKTSAGPIQGKNYVWQAQVGEAAVHLLHAALVEDPDVAQAQTKSAYDLLTEAAKGREQSPLLEPAIQTVLFLQNQAARQ